MNPFVTYIFGIFALAVAFGALMIVGTVVGVVMFVWAIKPYFKE